jgi:hypothetical protein
MLVGQMCAVARNCLAVCLLVNGCTSVGGGAVELSWKLRPASGSTDIFVNCDSQIVGTNPVTRIRLDWQVGETTGFASWLCTDYHGVTGFELPVGTASLSVSPECATGGAAPNTYTAPAPEQRSVIVGNTIGLGAVELVVQVGTDASGANRCTQQPCICH